MPALFYQGIQHDLTFFDDSQKFIKELVNFYIYASCIVSILPPNSLFKYFFFILLKNCGGRSDVLLVKLITK